ncbi:MAG: hypothetical protein ACRD9R_12775 [Pyrinomonadaceae bacterium]
MAELFEKHDIDRYEPSGRRLLRTLGGSLVFHALALGLILYVPSLRAALQITSTLSNLEFVDEAYDQTNIRDYEVTMLGAFDPDGKFRYPDGYFAAGAGVPDMTPLPPSPSDPIFIAAVRPTPLPIVKPAPTPKPEPSPSTAPTPEATASPVEAIAQNDQQAIGEPVGAAGANASPSPEPSKTAKELEKEAEATGAKKFPPVNKKPFTDWLAKANELKQKGELDLSGTLEMTLEGDRAPDGTLKNVEIKGASADNEKLYELIKSLVEALSDTRVLAVLEETEHLKMTVKLDEQSVSALVSTEMTSADVASQRANGYSLLLAAAKLGKAGRDEEVIFNNLKVVSEGKQINVTFNMPRTQATEMLKKQLPQTPAS